MTNERSITCGANSYRNMTEIRVVPHGSSLIVSCKIRWDLPSPPLWSCSQGAGTHPTLSYITVVVGLFLAIDSRNCISTLSRLVVIAIHYIQLYSAVLYFKSYQKVTLWFCFDPYVVLECHGGVQSKKSHFVSHDFELQLVVLFCIIQGLRHCVVLYRARHNNNRQPVLSYSMLLIMYRRANTRYFVVFLFTILLYCELHHHPSIHPSVLPSYPGPWRGIYIHHMESRAQVDKLIGRGDGGTSIMMIQSIATLQQACV